MLQRLFLVGTIGLLSGCLAAGTDPADGDVGAATSAAHGAFGEGELLATFGAPGFPEGVAVDGPHVYVSGPANFDMTESKVRVYHRTTGALLEAIDVLHPDGDPADPLSCIAVDGEHRLYVVSEAQGIVRLTKHGGAWEQEVYAPLPADGLPGCRHGAQFAPDFTDPMLRPPCHLLNDLAFDAAGRLFVTDSTRATIYRVEPGGGAMTPWFTSPYLLGGPPFPVGVNGIRISPATGDVVFSVTTSPLPDTGGNGRIYALPNVAAPSPADLAIVHEYPPFHGPDGFAFGASGELYVTLAFASQLSILGPSGAEISRLTGPSGSPVPYDSPANVAFDGKGSLLVTNHALLSGVTADMAVLKVYVGDRGAPLYAPGHED